MSAETADHEAELEKLCDRLEAHMGQANMQDVLRDANEAARLLREMAAENERLRGALEPFALLAVDEANDVGGINMSDPVSKWLTIAQLVEARLALTKGKPHD